MEKIKCKLCKFARQHRGIDEVERCEAEVVFCGWHSQFRAAELVRSCDEFKHVPEVKHG